MTNLQKYHRKCLLGAWGAYALDIFESIACFFTAVKIPNIVGAIIIILALVLEITVSLHANENDIIKRHHKAFDRTSLFCAVFIIFSLFIMLYMVSPFHH